MNQTKYLLNSALIVFLISTMLFACKSSPSPEEDPAVITFAIPATVTYFTQANFRGLAEDFNQANPDIEVQLRTISLTEIKQTDDLYNDILLNEEWGIDAFFMYASTIKKLTENDQILNLQPLVEADPSWKLDDFYPSVLAQFRHNGNLWGIPTEFIPLVIFYNKDLFDAAGVSYPQSGWTRDDFLETAVALKVSQTAKSFPFVGGSAAAIPFIYAHQGILLEQDRKCALNDPLTIESLKWYLDLALKHKVMPTLAQAESYEPDLPSNVMVGVGIYISDDGEIDEQVLRVIKADGQIGKAGQWGDAALWIDLLGKANGQHLQMPWRFRWGVAPLPRDTVESTMFDTYGCYITTHSKHPQKVLRWIQYLTQHRVNIAGIPARRSLARSATFQAVLPQEIDKTILDSILVQIERGQTPQFSWTVISNMAGQCLGGALVDIYERGEDVESALLKAQQELSEP